MNRGPVTYRGDDSTGRDLGGTLDVYRLALLRNGSSFASRRLQGDHVRYGDDLQLAVNRVLIDLFANSQGPVGQDLEPNGAQVPKRSEGCRSSVGADVMKAR